MGEMSLCSNWRRFRTALFDPSHPNLALVVLAGGLVLALAAIILSVRALDLSERWISLSAFLGLLLAAGGSAALALQANRS